MRPSRNRPLHGRHESDPKYGRCGPPNPAEWADRALWEEPFLVEEVASAVGAGDSTIAGFLAAVLRGCGPDHALKTACCVGGQNVKVFDAVSGIHTWEQTQAMIADWPKRRQAAGDAWSYDEPGGSGNMQATLPDRTHGILGRKSVQYLRNLVETIRPLMTDGKRYPKIQVYLVQSSDCEARTFPGGTIIFSHGLLEFGGSEAAVERIVGHDRAPGPKWSRMESN